MPGGYVRRISFEDIKQVQDLIERCLQLHMNLNEVVKTLHDSAEIEPCFTELVWKQLEEENKEFFRAYSKRMLLKDQITELNRLLEEHAKLSQRNSTAAASLTHSDGSHIPALSQNLSCYAAEQVGQVGADVMPLQYIITRPSSEELRRCP